MGVKQTKMSEVATPKEASWFKLGIFGFGSFAVKAANEDHAWDRLRAYGRRVNGVLNLDPDVLPTMKTTEALVDGVRGFDRRQPIYRDDDPAGITTDIVHIELIVPLAPKEAALYGQIQPSTGEVNEQLVLDMDTTNRFATSQ